MSARGRRPRTAMDRAADGLVEAGRALTLIYNASAQVLPETLDRVDRVLELAERATVALEKIADKEE